MPTSDRWPQVERIYHQALAREGAERDAFIREACGGDDALRREVESLLAHDAAAPAFLSVPAPELLGPRFLTSTITVGQRLGPYLVTALLGRGGMGDVYRARDETLGRDVAIKILPDVFARDSDRRARFDREARTLAALNHPHIAAIYGVEESSGVRGLILELVQGPTLAERLRDGPIPVTEALSIARQVADALSAAHAKGIVHRDLKPANIAMTDDGVVKVLDFGLAKSVAATSATESTSIGDEGPDRHESATHGVAGTASYMSPEQVCRAPVDERTDTWAFGCVVWAMLTGRSPFAAETLPETIAAILERDVEWHRLPPGVPAAVAALLRHCLERDPAHRLRDIAEAARQIERAIRAAPVDRRRWMVIAAGAVAVLATGAIGLVLMLGREPAGRATVPLTQITSFADSAVAPAISPDGRLLAFIRGEPPFLSWDDIYVKALPDGEAIQVTRDPRPKYGLAFSPDGTEIAYTVANFDGWNTYAVSVRGGSPRLVLRNAAGLNWLDPRRMLFSSIKSGLHMGIVMAREGQAERRELYYPKHQRWMAHYSFPSPDRRHALVVEMDYRPVWERCRLIPLDGSSAGSLVGPNGECSSAGWSPDGRWMYFTARVDREYQLWRARFPDGAPEQLTFGPLEADGVSVASDGSIVTSIGMQQATLWIHDRNGDRQLSAEGDIVSLMGSYTSPSFSPDGTHLYYLRRGASSVLELWRANVASGESESLLPGVGMVEYDVSSDGTRVVFTSQPKGRPSELWIASLDGSAPPRRIASTGENAPYFGPNGEVLFRFSDGTFNYLGRMNADGSGRTRVTSYPIATVHARSPDRRWIVAITPRLDGGPGAGSMAIPVSGGNPVAICPGFCYTIWSPDGKYLYIEVEMPTRAAGGKMVRLPVPAQRGLPALPADGIRSVEQALALAGGQLVEPSRIVPALDPQTWAFLRSTVHRNLFRVSPPGVTDNSPHPAETDDHR